MRINPNLRAIGAVLALDGGSRVTAQICMAFTARLLGPEEFGRFVVALTLFGLIVLFADAGLGDSALQRLTTRPNPGNAFRVGPAIRRLQTGLIVTAVALFGTSAGAVSGHLPLGTPILCLAIPAWILITNKALELRVLERFRASTSVMATLYFALNAGPLVAVMVIPNSIAAAATASAGMWLLAACRLHRIRTPSDSIPFHEYLKSGRPFLLTAVAVALYSRGDRLVLALFGDIKATGLYTAAYTIVLGASLLGSAIQIVALPHALREHSMRSANWAAVRRRILLAWGPSVLVVGLTILFAESIVQTLFGPGFVGAAPLLIALSPIIPLYLINPYLSTILIAAHRQQVVTRVAFTNLALASILFPSAILVGGAVYLAAASVIVELCGHCQMLIAVKCLLANSDINDNRRWRSLRGLFSRRH